MISCVVRRFQDGSERTSVGGEVLQPWIVARLQKLRNRPAIPMGGTVMLRFVFWHI